MQSRNIVEDDDDYYEILLSDTDILESDVSQGNSSNWLKTFSFKVNGTDCFGIESTVTEARAYLHKCQVSTISCHIVVSCGFANKVANEFEMSDLAAILPAVASSLSRLSRSCDSQIMGYWYSNNQIVFDIASLTKIGIMRFIPAIIDLLFFPDWSNIARLDLTSSSSSSASVSLKPISSVARFESDKVPSSSSSPLTQVERSLILDRILFPEPSSSSSSSNGSYIDRLKTIHTTCFVPDKLCVIFSGPLSIDETGICLTNIDTVFSDRSFVAPLVSSVVASSSASSSIISPSPSVGFDDASKVVVLDFRRNSSSCLCVMLWPIIGRSSVSDILVIKLIWRYLASTSNDQLRIQDYLIYDNPICFHAAILTGYSRDGLVSGIDCLKGLIVSCHGNIDLDQMGAIVDSEFNNYCIDCDNNWRDVVLTELMAQHNNVKIGSEDLSESENFHLQGRFCQFLDTLKRIRRMDRKDAQSFWINQIEKYFLCILPSCILVPSPLECHEQGLDGHLKQVASMVKCRTTEFPESLSIPLSIGKLFVKRFINPHDDDDEPVSSIKQDYLPEYSMAQVRSVLCQPTGDSRKYNFTTIQNYSDDDASDDDDDSTITRINSSNLSSEFYKRFKFNFEQSEVFSMTSLPCQTQITQANNCKLMQATVWLDTSGLSAYLRLFLEVFLEVIFHACDSNGNSDVSSRAKKCFISYEARLGTSQCNFNCGSWSQLISLNFRFHRNNLPTALETIKSILFDGTYSSVGMEGFVCRLLQEASWKDHDPYAIAYSFASCLMFDGSTSNAATTSVVPQISILRYVMQEIQSHPELMIERLTDLRRSVTRPHNVFFHLSGNVLKPIHTSDGAVDPLAVIIQSLSGYYDTFDSRMVARGRKINPFDMSIPPSMLSSSSLRKPRNEKKFTVQWSRNLRKFASIGSNVSKMRVVDVDSSTPVEFIQVDQDESVSSSSNAGNLSGKIFGVCESERSDDDDEFSSCYVMYLPINFSFYDDAIASLYVTLEYLTHDDSGFIQSLSNTSSDDGSFVVDVQLYVECGCVALTVFGKDIDPSRIHNGGLNWVSMFDSVRESAIIVDVLNTVRDNTILLFLERENTTSDAGYQCMMNTIRGVHGDYNSHMVDLFSVVKPADIISTIRTIIKPLIKLDGGFAVWIDRKCHLKKKMINFIDPNNLKIMTFGGIVNEFSPFDFNVYTTTASEIDQKKMVVEDEKQEALSPFVIGLASLAIGGLAVAGIMLKKWK